MRFSEVILEKFFQLEVKAGTCLVHENPTLRTLMGMLDNSKWSNVRGLITGSDIFWWDSALANHDEIAPVVGVDDLAGHTEEDGSYHSDPRCLVMAKEPDGSSYLAVDPAYREHPRLARLIGNDKIVLESQGGSPSDIAHQVRDELLAEAIFLSFGDRLR
jgi:hypothetical protein